MPFNLGIFQVLQNIDSFLSYGELIEHLIKQYIKVYYVLSLYQVMNLKQFDFFRKVNTDIHQGNKIGGVLSVIAITVLLILQIAFVLIYDATHNYLHPKLTSFLTIQSDPDPFLFTQIEILFNHMPCQSGSALSVIQFHWIDQVQSQLSNVQQHLNMSIVNVNNQVVKQVELSNKYKKNQNRNIEIDQAKKSIDEGDQCLIQGNLSLPKTNGYLRISSDMGIINGLSQQQQSKIRNSYYLAKLIFGRNSNQKIEIPQHQSKSLLLIRVINQYIKSFSSEQHQSFLRDKVPHEYYSHIKVIPMRFGDKEKHESISKYKYSIKTGMTKRSDIQFTTNFYIQMSPVNVVYHYEQREFYFLIVQILGVLGGLFSAFGILNSIAAWISDIISSK